MRSLVEELLVTALLLLAAAVALSWVWMLLRPLLPFLVGGVAVGAIGRFYFHRWSGDRW
ncbi:MAG: hypothetical protein M3O32_00370 [Actinomycetota bacterium]|nr:hypothetical protein [Actinomycetota bacterium]